jgi:pimeloyl-ACP methyl ester carboxylesterase
LGGHSFGGGTSLMYAQDHPEKIKGLFPIATIISGELSLDTPTSNPRRQSIAGKWKKDGVLVQRRRNGDEKRLKWACMEDRLKYNLLTKAHELTMPVLMIVGDMDESTPLEHQQLLFNKLPGKKELHVIKGAVHTFDNSHERDELKRLLKSWASSIENY